MFNQCAHSCVLFAEQLREFTFSCPDFDSFLSQFKTNTYLELPKLHRSATDWEFSECVVASLREPLALSTESFPSAHRRKRLPRMWPPLPTSPPSPPKSSPLAGPDSTAWPLVWRFPRALPARIWGGLHQL